MTTEGTNSSRVYQRAVTALGLCLWLAAALSLPANHAWREQLAILALVPLIVVVGMFVQHFKLPLGLRFTHERITFTFADAMILVAACWLGIAPAIFLAGIEGFTSSRRTTRRLSSNLFSSGIMSLGAAGAAASFAAVLRYGFGVPGVADATLFSVAIALLIASVVQIAANIVFLSTLLALRHNQPVLSHWRDFLWATPMFLPNSAAATLLYLGLQHDLTMIFVIGGPVFLAIFLGQRHYRDSVQKRILIMEKGHRETIEALAVAINAKDEVTHEHVLRVQIYAAGVARVLGCSEAEIEALRAGALLHDIGKIAVPDFILNKPGKLTTAEFEKMKFHTIAGAQILGRVEFPYPVVPVVRHHHERWDGNGYPDGLKGEAIPLTARILSVVDCFDAVREDRQYRKGMTREQAIELIESGSGSQYDPNVVETFIKNLPTFEAEIQSHRNAPMPTFGIEPSEQLSEAARRVIPAAGLAENEAGNSLHVEFTSKEMRALYALAKAVNGASDREEILAAFTEKLQYMVPYELCAITLVVPVTGQSVVAHAAGEHAAFVKGRKTSLGEGVTGWVIVNGKPFCNTDPKLDLPLALTDQCAAYRTLAVFPIVKGRQMHGALSLYSSGLTEYTKDHQKLLAEASMLLATALSASSAPEASNLIPVLATNPGALNNIRITNSGSLSLADILPESELTQ